MTKHRNRRLKTDFPVAGAIGSISAIALIALLTAGCQTNKAAKGPEPVGKDVQMTELRRTIQTRIADPGRSATLLGMVGNVEKGLGAMNKDYLKRSQEFGKMSADHSKTANDLNTYLRGWEAQSRAERSQLANALLAMKPYTSAEEWPAVSNAFITSVMQQSDRYQDIRQLNY